jgi:DNA-binding MarR family transcriptional regulator
MTSLIAATLTTPVTGPDLCHCLAARRSARFLTRLYDRHLAPSGLSISQFSILALVEVHPEISIATLADLMVMERTTLLRAIKPLREGGLLLCEARGTKALLALQLSAAGKEKMALVGPYWLAAQKEFEEQAGAERADTLRREALQVVFTG